MKKCTLDHPVGLRRLMSREIAEREAARQAARHAAHRHAIVNVLLGEVRRLMTMARLLRAAERRERLRAFFSSSPEPAQAPNIHRSR